MKYNNVEINILIKGKKVTEYPHNGQLFIEGRDGSAFEVELINHTAERVEMIVSVDGLSILDGKEAGANSPGYVLNAYETSRIPGWKLDNASVASFEFCGKANSYATGVSKSSQNNGVIGLLVYKEKLQTPIYATPVYTTTPQSWGMPSSSLNDYEAFSPFDVARHFSGNVNVGGSPKFDNSIVTNCLASASASNNLRSADFARTKATSASSTDASVQNAINTVQHLGTAFGEKQNFATTQTTFQRADMLAYLVIHYDNLRGLKARGVEVNKRVSRKITETPNPFPGMSGCVPPKGWTGK